MMLLSPVIEEQVRYFVEPCLCDVSNTVGVYGNRMGNMVFREIDVAEGQNCVLLVYGT
jgi:hypothetical protein